ncbi:hypothetical protein XB02_01515 [Pantoea ananatis]|nr:hypothetical protein XB02_01515 [Pantoea ananatis]
MVMVKAILKGIDCMHKDPRTYAGEDDGTIAITLSLSIGSEQEKGSDYFDVFICTPEWLCKHHWLPELMRHTLLVRKYDLDEIKKTITDYINQCEGKDWMEIAQKLSRVFAWEFEDYQP